MLGLLLCGFFVLYLMQVLFFYLFVTALSPCLFSYGFHLEFYSSLNVSFVLISCEFPSVNFIHVSVSLVFLFLTSRFFLEVIFSFVWF